MQHSEDHDDLILEGIIVTLDAAGTPNIAPMGPRVDRQLSKLVLRPYTTAQTYRNLKATGSGVFHVTDDVLLLAQAAIGQLDPPPPLIDLDDFPCPRLADACRWFAIRVQSLDDSSERTTIECSVATRGELRPFFGFNRAKHAVLEAAILATRIGILPAAEIRSQLQRLISAVEKTAGSQERSAFALLQNHIHSHLTPVP
jgi:uncharacterized protein